MGMSDMFADAFKVVLGDASKAPAMLDMLAKLSNGQLVPRPVALKAYEDLKKKAHDRITETYNKAYEKGWKEGQEAVEILAKGRVGKGPSKPKAASNKVKQAPTPE